MKIGDLVRERPQGIYLFEKHKRRMGVITDVDPLRKAIAEQWTHNHQVPIARWTKTVEIVILLTNGTRWFAAPGAWEVISESR
jgi:hypothetical protein